MHETCRQAGKYHGYGTVSANSFVYLTQARVIWEKETSIKRNTSISWPVGKPVGTFFIND